jgi:FMN phosphatase YigB (HAD superfamily)
MRIGIDFDNTLVTYDELFHRVALDQQVIPAGLAKTKVAVRDYLRRIDREPVWTEMQGTVYGARMDEARAYPGAIEFLRWACTEGIELCIVSHKTRHPFIGPKHDLHQAARRWIERHLAGKPHPLIAPHSVFFELTKEEKLARIAASGCAYYIDDLPEILLAPGFPARVRRILFDADAHHVAEPSLTVMRSWNEIRAFFEHECRSTG